MCLQWDWIRDNIETDVVNWSEGIRHLLGIASDSFGTCDVKHAMNIAITV